MVVDRDGGPVRPGPKAGPDHGIARGLELGCLRAKGCKVVHRRIGTSIDVRLVVGHRTDRWNFDPFPEPCLKLGPNGFNVGV